MDRALWLGGFILILALHCLITKDPGYLDSKGFRNPESQLEGGRVFIRFNCYDCLARDADRKEDVENDLDDDCGDSCDSDEVRYAHQGRLFWIIVCIRVPISNQGIPRARYDAVRLGEAGGPGSPKHWHTPDSARCRSGYRGHARLNCTLTYARVHDETVARDYYAAMQWVEKHMALSCTPQDNEQDFPVVLRQRLLLVAEQLREPELDAESRLALVDQFCGLLEIETVEEVD